MTLFSTSNRTLQASWREAVLHGLAPDGGLYLPHKIPHLPNGLLCGSDSSRASIQFYSLASTIASDFIGAEVSADDLLRICKESFSFPLPVVPLSPDTSILELFHGPTCAFKDFGARFMAQLFRYFNSQIKDNIQPLTVLVATSGDTGSAVANAFFDPSPTPPIHVAILFPKGKVSAVQEKQMTTLGHNVRAFEVDGTFDDCQRLVKQALADHALTSRIRLTSANSINIARLLPQMFYYVWAALQTCDQGPPLFVVPSGNLGNLTGGVLAALAGLPTEGFVAACNANDVYPQFLSSGEFSPRASSETLSNAMDVGNPSNFARLKSLLTNSPVKIHGASITDAETLQTIRSTFENTGYILDPHTAVGVAALQRVRANNLSSAPHAIVLATAHPAKFASTVESAIGQSPTLPPQLKAALDLPSCKIPLSCNYQDFIGALDGNE